MERSGLLQLAVGGMITGERSEPEGVAPPSRYKGLELKTALFRGVPSGLFAQLKWGGAPLRFPKRTRGYPSQKPTSEIPPFLDPKDPYKAPFSLYCYAL